MNAIQLAKMFHESYEELAPQFGYETREASRKPWEDVPEKNQKLMIAVAGKILLAQASPQRPQLSAADINLTFSQLQNKTRDRLGEKGAGILISRHEMLGVVEEEYHELVHAVESGSTTAVIDELVDIAVACIVSLASFKTGQVEW